VNRLFLKLPTNPLCPFKMINVRVSGVTESAGTSIWTTLLIRLYNYVITFPFLFFFKGRKRNNAPYVRFYLYCILSVSSFTLASIDKYSRLLVIRRLLGSISYPMWPISLTSLAIDHRLGRPLPHQLPSQVKSKSNSGNNSFHIYIPHFWRLLGI